MIQISFIIISAVIFILTKIFQRYKEDTLCIFISVIFFYYKSIMNFLIYILINNYYIIF